MGTDKRPHRKWLTSDGIEPVDEIEDQSPSRSQRTREVKAINQLGIKLVALSKLKLDGIELPDDLRDAIEKCRALTKGARVRQKRLVCKMLRSEDHEAIREQVESL